jgi:hypothetical protein
LEDNVADEPMRTLDKQEATRHLIHAAIRMFSEEEDPFAIHVLIHAAENTLIDVAKKTRKQLRVDWESYIKKEYHGDFFTKYREIYNFLKHADRDFGTNIPVRDIMTGNVTTLFICISNYAALFGEWTNHMMRFQSFVLALRPEFIGADFPQRDKFWQSVRGMQTMTPREFFKIAEEKSDMMPIHAERSRDLEDTGHFYHLTFEELRAGKKKSPRLHRLPNF